MGTHNGWYNIDTFKAAQLIANDEKSWKQAVQEPTKDNIEYLLLELTEALDVEYLMFSEINFDELINLVKGQFEPMVSRT